MSKTYNTWEDVPPTMKTKTQWSELGRKLKPGATAVGYKSGKYGVYALYYERSTTLKKVVTKAKDVIVPEILTLDDILEALYIINKNAKNLLDKHNKRHDYKLKTDVLAKLVAENKHTKIENHYAAHSQTNRQYIIRGHYEDEDEYYEALGAAVEDDQGRPYIEGETRNVYDLFECIYFGETSYHQPLRFGIVLHHGETITNEWLKKNNYIPLSENDVFVSPRKNVKNIRMSRAILTKYLTT